MCAADNSSEKRGVIIWTSLLPEPSGPELVARFGEFPREFHHGALHAGFDLMRGDTLPLLRRALKNARAENRPIMIFVYSLRIYDVLVLARYAHRVPTVVYYQNVDPALMPVAKRLMIHYALRKARLVLVQDALRLARFARSFGADRVRFFPWIVDDAFFDPHAVATPVEPSRMLFVPGDRGRLDDVVIEIARRTGRRVVRVARFFTDPVMAAYQTCPLVDLRYYVRWDELLRLYRETAIVLNVTDDGETSAGMTSFLEGLAMNALVMTPAGHSSAGYEFPDGFKPYITIDQPRSADAWVEAINKAERSPPVWPAGRSPRDLFLTLSGMSAAARRWQDLFTDVTS